MTGDLVEALYSQSTIQSSPNAFFFNVPDVLGRKIRTTQSTACVQAVQRLSLLRSVHVAKCPKYGDYFQDFMLVLVGASARYVTRTIDINK